MNPTTVQNVVTYDAIVDFDNPELKLFPGMTAYVTIPVDTAANVLKIANGALRYKPQIAPDEMRALYSRYGIGSDDNDFGTTGPADRHAGPGSATAPHIDGDLLGNMPSGSVRGSRPSVVVWKLHPDESIEPVQIVTGITDHAYTVVLDNVRGELKEGDLVITGALVAKCQPQGGSNVGAPPKK
jgi:HlyD family secretion protein